MVSWGCEFPSIVKQRREERGGAAAMVGRIAFRNDADAPGLRNYDYRFSFPTARQREIIPGLLLLPIGLFKSIVVYFCTVERRICMRFGAGIDSDCWRR